MQNSDPGCPHSVPTLYGFLIGPPGHFPEPLPWRLPGPLPRPLPLHGKWMQLTTDYAGVAREVALGIGTRKWPGNGSGKRLREVALRSGP